MILKSTFANLPKFGRDGVRWQPPQLMSVYPHNRRQYFCSGLGAGWLLLAPGLAGGGARQKRTDGLKKYSVACPECSECNGRDEDVSVMCDGMSELGATHSRPGVS